MKTIPAGLAAHFAQETTTVAQLFKMVRSDGTVYGFTTHDQPIVYGGLTYEPAAAVAPSQVAAGSELSVDNLDIAGAFDSAAITETDLEAGRWDGASFTVYEINWADTSQGVLTLKTGELGRVRRSGKAWTAELLGLTARLQRNIGRKVLPTCDADLGDARCTVNLASFTHSTTITSVTSRSVFTASGLAQAAGYFRYGTVQFTSGANSGVLIDIAEHTTGGVLRTVIDLPFDAAVGDSITAVRGCNKRGRAGDCKLVFDNLENFRGFEDVPGNDALIGAL